MVSQYVYSNKTQFNGFFDDINALKNDWTVTIDFCEKNAESIRRIKKVESIGSFAICKCTNMSQIVCQYFFETVIGGLETIN